MESGSKKFGQLLSADDWMRLFKKNEFLLRENLHDLFPKEKNATNYVYKNSESILSRSNWCLLRLSNTTNESPLELLQRAYIGLTWQFLFDEISHAELKIKCGKVFDRFPDAQHKAINYAFSFIGKNHWYRLNEYQNNLKPSLMLETAIVGCIWEYFFWENESRFRWIAQRRVPMDEVLADTLHDKTHIKLSAVHYKRVANSYAGKGSPQAYLLTAYNSVFSDVIDSEYGKCRPPTWVKRLGKEWAEAFKWLCCKKKDIDSFISNASNKNLIDSAEDGEFIVRQLLAKIPSCQTLDVGRIPNAINHTSSDQNDDVLNKLKNQQNHDEMEILLKILADLISEQQQDSNMDQLYMKISSIKSSQWQEFGDVINQEVNSQQVIAMRLIFQDKFSVRQASEMLKVPQSKIIRYREDTLKVLKSSIEGLGIFDISDLDEIEL